MPVSKLMGQSIINLTRSEGCRDKVVFTVDLSTDLEALRKVGAGGCWGCAAG
jgi:small-conductance mechanosensitive channel